ncbi:hypothetical protein MFIFM68171_03421 [Madurella fahalii]|uniref:Uncharacterized protein n=1 Tax=Madurella fahalii TaxID=1157608 RepID=A0ABQ0G645_9PEZI
MPPQAEDPKPKLPVAPDVNQIFNRIALGMAKHQRIFDTLAKHRKPTSAAPTAATGGGGAAAAGGGGGGGFSSLAAGKAAASAPAYAAPTTTNDSSSSSRGSNGTTPRHTDDADLNPAYALPPNAGVGYVPANAAAAAANSTVTAADRDRAQLRSKVLGRNAARQLELAERARAAGHGPKKRGVARDDGSESEEEVGRGAMVRDRGRGAQKKTMGLSTAAGRVAAAGPGSEADSGEDEVKGGRGRKTKRARLGSSPPGSVMGVGSAASGQEEKAGRDEDAVMDDARVETAAEGSTPLPEGDGVEGPGQKQPVGEKKRRKKKKNKKKKSNDRKGEGEVEAAE